MIAELGATNAVKQLRKAGIRPSEQTVQAILKAGEAAYEPLFELASNVDLLHSDEEDAYAPIHALRLLGEMPRVDMIEPLLSLLPLELLYADEQPPRLWAEELTQMIGRLGAAAVAPLWALLDDPNRSNAVHGSAAAALSYAAAFDTAVEDDIVAEVRKRLGSSDKIDNAFYTMVLSNLAVKGSYQEVMALYREGKIDTDLMPARITRQSLLGSGKRRAACVLHPLWERYDEHGPRIDSQ